MNLFFLCPCYKQGPIYDSLDFPFISYSLSHGKWNQPKCWQPCLLVNNHLEVLYESYKHKITTLHVFVPILVDKWGEKCFDFKFFQIFRNLQTFWASTMIIQVVDLSKLLWINELNIMIYYLWNFPIQRINTCRTFKLRPSLFYLKPLAITWSIRILTL